MNIDCTKLKRDYKTNPITSKKDLPPKEDIEYLYIKMNLQKDELAEVLNISANLINYFINYFEIKKSRKLVAEAQKRRLFEKYGVTNMRQIPGAEEKRKQTCLKKYGVDNPNKCKEIREKTKKTCLKKYGTEYSLQAKEIRDQIKKTCLEKYGATCNLAALEIKEKIKQKWINAYGVDNPGKSKEIREKAKQTNLERYGVEYAAQNPKVKEKMKRTCLERYGAEYSMQNPKILAKAQKTNLEKYGSVCSLHGKEIEEKVRKTVHERYGTDYAIQNEEVKEKRRQNNIEKWGTSNWSTKHLDPEILRIIQNKDLFIKTVKDEKLNTIYDISDYFNVSYSAISKKLVEFGCKNLVVSPISRAEQVLSKMFPSFVKTRKIISPYEIDLYGEEFKLGIEFNGDYWHCDKMRDKYYHQQKSKLAEDKGVFIYHVFEHEWHNERTQKIILSQLKNLTNQSYIIDAGKCTLQEISSTQSDNFLQENHLQGKDQNSIRYGLLYKDELVAVMTFCKPRFNETFDWELSRFCNKQGLNVLDGASKLFKYFKENYSGSIISYSNISKTKGIMYEKLGFHLDHVSEPNYIWLKGKRVLPKCQTQEHRLNDFLDSEKTETEVMESLDYIRVYDCGNKIWVMN